MDLRSTTPSSPPGTGDAVHPEQIVAERWADFTKARFIYPLSNVRVQQSLDQLFEALDRAHEARRAESALNILEGVAILFREQRLCYGETEMDIVEGTTLAWLRARLDPAALAGVEFLPDLTREDLIAFTEQLLQVYLRRDADPVFKKLWPDPMPGLTLVDRRFEGSFGGRPQSSQPYRGGHASRGALDGKQLELVRVLLLDPEVAGKIKALNEYTTSECASAEDTEEAGTLLDRIMQNMPADALKDRETLLEHMRGVLDALVERLADLDGQNELSEANDDMTLSALLYSASRTHFARSGPDLTRWTREDTPSANAAAPGKLGHEGDDAVAEDYEALVEELEALPSTGPEALTRREAESPAEELAVALHYLFSPDTPQDLPGLPPTLDRLLEDVGKEQLDVLREYLSHHGDCLDENGITVKEPPLLTYLKSTGRTHLLRACGVFEVKWVVRVFPQYFTLYLESLDLRAESDVRELDEVCKAVGPERMLAAEIEDEGRRLGTEQIQGLFVKASVHRLPLVRILLKWHGKRLVSDVTQFLRRLDLPESEAFLLYQISNAEILTTEYLAGLIDVHLGRIEPGRLHLAISDVLCRHIRETRRVDPRSPGRLESIRNLTRYPSANSWYLLRELSKGFWLPFLAKEPAVVRQLARATLKRQGNE